MPTKQTLGKLNMPQLPEVLNRLRMFELIKRACKRPVVCVAAVLGVGKTTLIVSYLTSRKWRSNLDSLMLPLNFTSKAGNMLSFSGLF